MVNAILSNQSRGGATGRRCTPDACGVTLRLDALIGALLIVCATAFGAPDARPSGTEVPAHWREVGSVEKRIEVLEFLAAQSEANYEKLRTWRATYSISGDMQYSVAFARELFKVDRPLRWQVKATLQFVVDKESQATYLRHDRQSHQHLDIVTGKPVEDPNISRLLWDRLVITPETYLHAHYGHGFGLLPEVRNRPHLLGRPLAYRDPRSQGDDLLKDFRIYTYFTFFDREWFWEVLRWRAEWLRKEGPQWDVWRQAIRIYESKAANGNWYKYDYEYTSPEGQQIFARTLFSPAAGYLPVEDLHEGKATGDAKREVLRHRVWQWKEFGGVYVPGYFKEVHNSAQETGPDIEEQVLLHCEVNNPIDPVQFTWAGMDLPEGTVVMDRVEGAAYLWERGKLNRLARAAEASEARAWVSWLRWVLAGVTLGAVALVGMLAWRRRRGNRIRGAR